MAFSPGERMRLFRSHLSKKLLPDAGDVNRPRRSYPYAVRGSLEKRRSYLFHFRPGTGQVDAPASRSLSSWPCRICEAAHRPTAVMPAATAALMPLALSSITRHDFGSTPSLSAANRNMSGMRLSARHHIGAEYVGRRICRPDEDSTGKAAGDRSSWRRRCSGVCRKFLNELAGPAYFPEIGAKPIERGGLEIVGKAAGTGLPTAASICAP